MKIHRRNVKTSAGRWGGWKRLRFGKITLSASTAIKIGKIKPVAGVVKSRDETALHRLSSLAAHLLNDWVQTRRLSRVAEPLFI
jgi:hypothetical protein